MFPTWRLRLREARVACRNGHFDEAGELLTAESLREFLPAKQLACEVAGKIAERARDRFARGESSAGWHDLEKAGRLGGQLDAIAAVRTVYSERIMEESCCYLVAGQASAAVALLDKLGRRGVTNERSRVLREVAQFMQEGERRAVHGHFEEAATLYTRAADVAKRQSAGMITMDEIEAKLRSDANQFTKRAIECQRLTSEMHAAVASENWTLALSTADGLLALAPQHVAAGQARRRAWKAVGMDVTQMYHGRRGPVSLQWNQQATGRRSTRGGSRSNEDDTVAGKENPQRSLLWIDAVGGFLVCHDENVVLGQPSPGNVVAVPILADISRRHAVIRRDAGAYVLEPLQKTLVNGREIKAPHVLADNHVIQLGDNVRIQFSRPHALSATARLVMQSHHKTHPSVDAVLLMADSCVMGPSSHCHIRCREWKHDLVVYRQDDRMYCRAEKAFTIDGFPASGSGQIASGVRIEGEEFAFTWETIV